MTAGTVNYDGQLSVRAVHSGGDTAVADIVRMVEEAQGRAAPVQRFADVVAVSRRAGWAGRQRGRVLLASCVPRHASGGARLIPRRLCCLPPPLQGKFTYGVMGVAAATFLFWSGAGTRLFPQVPCTRRGGCGALEAGASGRRRRRRQARNL